MYPSRPELHPFPPHPIALGQPRALYRWLIETRKDAQHHSLLEKCKSKSQWGITLVRMPIIKMSTKNKCWRLYGEKGALLHCWWECRLVQPLWRTVWRFLKNLGIELPYDPAIPLLGIHTKEIGTERNTCNPMFTVAPFTIARTWKQPRCPLAHDEWIRKLWFTYTMEYSVQFSSVQSLSHVRLFATP